MTTSKENLSSPGVNNEVIDLAWKNLTVKYGGKTAIDNVSGFVPGGSLVAVMGKTGAGKTTLLSALADQIAIDSGHVLYDGKEITHDRVMKRSIGFVDQDDIFVGEMTIERSLLEQALFRQPDKELARKKVARVLEHLKISPQAKQKLSTVSGGQRKRFCIARELIGDPDVLFLDESTSGLDSAIAKLLVQELRELVDTQKTSVFMSIQQPSEVIYNMFDLVMLIDDGKVYYYGPPRKALQHFQRFSNAAFKFDDDVPTFLMEVVNKNLFERDGAHITTEMAMEPAVDYYMHRNLPKPPKENIYDKSFSMSIRHWFSQVWLLSKRLTILEWDHTFNWRAAAGMLLAIFIAAWIFFRPGLDYDGMQTRRRNHLWMAGLFYWLGLYLSLTMLLPINALLAKDLRAQNYNIVQFWVAKCFGALWLSWVWPFCAIIVYWLIAWPNPMFSTWMFIIAQVLINTTVSTWVGLLISLCFSLQNALLFVLTYTTFCFSWASFFEPGDSLIPWLKWLRVFNLFGYYYEMQIYAVFNDDLVFPCSPTEQVNGEQVIKCPADAVDGKVTGTQLVNSKDPDYFQMDIQPWVAWMVVLLGFGLGSIVLGQIMIWWNNRVSIYGPNHSRKTYVETINANEAEINALTAKAPFAKLEDFTTIPSDSECTTPPICDRSKDDDCDGNPRDTRVLPSCAKRTKRHNGPNVTVTVEHLSVAYNGKPALHNVTFGVPAGSTTALMGPSGSGKTTAINAILNKIPEHVTRGRVLYNGQPWDSSMRQYFGFVEQDDIVIPGLTVRQSLNFTAKLRIADTTLHEKRINSLLADLQLEDCADMTLGAVSAGQRKRACMARELLGEPLCLVLDEPTSSLDATMALELVEIVSKLAKNSGMTIIASIHQPSQTIFRSFDNVFLVREGHQMYFGAPQKVLPFYKSFGLERPKVDDDTGFSAVTTQSSAAEYMLDLMVLDNQMTEQQRTDIEETALVNGRAAVADIQDKYPAHISRSVVNGSAGVTSPRSEIANDLDAADAEEAMGAEGRRGSIVEPIVSPPLVDGTLEHQGNLEHQNSPVFEFTKRRQVSWWATTMALWQRMLAMEFKMYFGWAELASLLGTALALLCMFNIYGREALAEDVQVHRNVGLWITQTWIILSVTNSIFKFFISESILRKELSTGTHSLSAWYVARVILMQVYDFTWCLMWMVIAYWMMNPNPDVGVFFSVLAVTTVFVTYIGRVVAFTLSYAIKLQDVPMVMVCVMVFSIAWNPYFLPDNGSLGEGALWLRYLSVITYQYGAIMHLLLTDDIKFSCQYQVDNFHVVYNACKNQCYDALGQIEPGCKVSGADLISAGDMSIHVSLGACIGIMCGIAVGFTIIGFLVLRFRLRSVYRTAKNQIN